ncbi:MAG: hypothetical protein Q9208_004581 [Pyrenodesmia sp. 3 TL-2023]
MASRRSNVISLSDIPTVSQLYKSGDLRSPDNTETPFTPSAALNSKVALVRTSITDLEVTSIVNAANSSLLGGGGVVSVTPSVAEGCSNALQDGAIHSAAGPDLLDECETLGGCETGSAKITAAYRLPSQYIIHAVGPVYGREKRKRDGLQAELLASCYQTSLELAAEKGGSIAFSCLSTGIYGYPSHEAAEIACRTVRAFLESEKGQSLDRIVFCCFLKKDESQYQEYLPLFFPPSPEELPSSEIDQGSVVGKEADRQHSEQQDLPSSTTETSQQDDWVTVEKPTAAAGSIAASTSNHDDLPASCADNEAEATADAGSSKLDTQQDGSKVQNSLMKDW